MKRFTISPYTGPQRKRVQVQRMNLTNPFFTTGWKFTPASFTNVIKINPIEQLEPARVYPKPFRQKFIVVPSREGRIIPRKGIETTHPLNFENHFFTTGVVNRPQTYNALLQSSGVTNVEMSEAMKYSKWLGELSNAGIKDMTSQRKDQLKNLYGSDVAEALALGDQRILNAVKSGEIAPGLSIASQIGLNRSFMSKRLQAALFALKSYQDKAKQYDKLKQLQKNLRLEDEANQDFQLTNADKQNIQKLMAIVREEIKAEEKQIELARQRESQGVQDTVGTISSQPLNVATNPPRTAKEQQTASDALLDMVYAQADKNETEQEGRTTSDKPKVRVELFSDEGLKIKPGSQPNTVTTALRVQTTMKPLEPVIKPEPLDPSKPRNQITTETPIPTQVPSLTTVQPLGEARNLIIPRGTKFLKGLDPITVKQEITVPYTGDLFRDIGAVIENLPTNKTEFLPDEQFKVLKAEIVKIFEKEGAY